MGAAGVVPGDAPLMVAWMAWQKTTGDWSHERAWQSAESIRASWDEIEGLRVTHPHLSGALWTAFMAGYLAANPDGALSPVKPKVPDGLSGLKGETVDVFPGTPGKSVPYVDR